MLSEKKFWGADSAADGAFYLSAGVWNRRHLRRIQTQLESKGVLSSKIKLLPNSIDLEFMQSLPSNTAFRARAQHRAVGFFGDVLGQREWQTRVRGASGHGGAIAR